MSWKELFWNVIGAKHAGCLPAALLSFASHEPFPIFCWGEGARGWQLQGETLEVCRLGSIQANAAAAPYFGRSRSTHSFQVLLCRLARRAACKKVLLCRLSSAPKASRSTPLFVTQGGGVSSVGCCLPIQLRLLKRDDDLGTTSASSTPRANPKPQASAPDWWEACRRRSR